MHRRLLTAFTLLLIAIAASLAPGDTLAEDPPATAPRDPAFGQSFGYQGRLVLDGIPASGAFDFQFILYDAPTQGMQINDPELRTLTVANGLFSTTLAFGLDSPLESGKEYWVEVRVKRPADGAYTTLNPRQQLSPAPYAVTAGTLPAGTVIDYTTAPLGFGLGVQSFDLVNQSVGALGIKQGNELVGVGGQSGSTGTTIAIGGKFIGSSLGVLADSSKGYGVRTKSTAGAHAALLAEHTGGNCTGTTVGDERELGNYCFAVAGIADGESTSGIGVYGFGSNTAIWGVTNNPSGYSGYFSGGKVRMSDGTTFGVTSDGRLKKDIASLSIGLDELLQLKPSTYAWKSDPTSATHYGFIAQDVREVIPGIVDEDTDGTLSLEPLGLLPVIVKSIQEQQSQLDAIQPSSSPQATMTVSSLSRPVILLFAAAIIVTALVAGAAGAVLSQRLLSRR